MHQTPPRSIAVRSIVVSVLIYILVIASNFDPAVNAKLIEAFGATPFGLPVILVVALVETILYIPMPWIFWHGMLILDQALEDGVIARPQRFFLVPA